MSSPEKDVTEGCHAAGSATAAVGLDESMQQSGVGNFVSSLTEPVWPKAKTVTAKPCNAPSTRSSTLQTAATFSCKCNDKIRGRSYKI